MAPPAPRTSEWLPVSKSRTSLLPPPGSGLPTLLAPPPRAATGNPAASLPLTITLRASPTSPAARFALVFASTAAGESPGSTNASIAPANAETAAKATHTFFAALNLRPLLLLLRQRANAASFPSMPIAPLLDESDSSASRIAPVRLLKLSPVRRRLSMASAVLRIWLKLYRPTCEGRFACLLPSGSSCAGLFTRSPAILAMAASASEPLGSEELPSPSPPPSPAFMVRRCRW
mmetsp:Transcript_22262/g.65957  ORF Transcript_22262/g.65957 Transcript_22262/m.65957 type:complete len:233 (-) Transcript_22262:111-809(-)